jgi:hypothetical protein
VGYSHFSNIQPKEYKPNNSPSHCPLELYLHICQSGTEVLVNVGLKYRMKMLELEVSYQGNDKYLPKEDSIDSSTAQPRHWPQLDFNNWVSFFSSSFVWHFYSTIPELGQVLGFTSILHEEKEMIVLEVKE